MSPQLTEGENTASPSADHETDASLNLDLVSSESGGAEAGSVPGKEEDPPQSGKKEGTEGKAEDAENEDPLSHLSEAQKARLAKMGGASTDKSKDEGKKEQAKPPGDGKPPADGKKPDEKTGKPPGKTEDPYSADVEKQLEGSAKVAFIKGRTELAKARKELETIKPVADFGDSFASILKEHNAADDFDLINDQQVAEAIKAQGCLTRVAKAWEKRTSAHPRDIEDLQKVHADLTESLNKFGVPAVGALKPFKGDLPDDMQRLVDYGVDENTVRLLAAMSGNKDDRREVKQEKQERVEKKDERRDDRFGHREEQHTSNGAQTFTEVEVRVAAGKLQRHLIAEGIKPDKLAQTIKGTLRPYVMNNLLPKIPGQTPDQVMASLPLATRHDLFVEALSILKKRALATKTGSGKRLEAPPASIPQSRVGPQGRMARGDSSNGSSVASKLARMAGTGDEE